jgi:hypothetical protein
MPCSPSGFRFKQGKLYIFTTTGVMLLETWPALRAVHKHDDDRWKEFTPAFRVVRPYRPRKLVSSAQLELDLGPEGASHPRDDLAAQRKRAFDAFYFSLPKPVAARTEKFQSQQWNMLRLFQAREQTLELAKQNPALCFALANCRSFLGCRARRPLEEAVAVSMLRQRDIAGWLGFPPTDGAARILAKLAPESASVDLLLPLRDALRQADVSKTLAHMPRLNAGVTAIALDPGLLAATTARLLEEVAATGTEKYQAATAQLIHDTLRMYFCVHPRRGAPCFQSLSRLREIHDQVSVEYLRQEAPVLRAFRFPPPPLRGTAEIVPIRTVEELVAEGEGQENCVAIYAERVQNRRTYIYRVLKPERATLSIVLGPDGDWRIDELKRRANADVSTLTRALVQAWLDEHALSA